MAERRQGKTADAGEAARRQSRATARGAQKVAEATRDSAERAVDASVDAATTSMRQGQNAAASTYGTWTDMIAESYQRWADTIARVTNPGDQTGGAGFPGFPAPDLRSMVDVGFDVAEGILKLQRSLITQMMDAQWDMTAPARGSSARRS